MAGVRRDFYSRLSDAVFGHPKNSHIQHSDDSTERYGSDRYKPSVREVVAVKEALHKKSTLPYELIDAIVDMAEYWPCSTSVLTTPVNVNSGRGNQNCFLLRSYPLGYPQQQLDPILQQAPGNDQLAFKHDQNYERAQPNPWPETRPVPRDATDEVLAGWASQSLPKGEYPCRKIVFTIKSHDQGWGGRADHKGTYDGSYTWFDVGLERVNATREGITPGQPQNAPTPQLILNSTDGEPGPLFCNLRTILPVTTTKPPDTSPDDLDTFFHDLLPSAMVLQKNVTAIRDTREHEIAWSFDDIVITDSIDAIDLEKKGRGKDTGNGQFVRNLKIGDVVTVWAKARFPGWTNVVEEVRMDVYWAV